MTQQVVTLGEAMLRLSPPTGVPLTTATSLDLHVAGSEANLAVCLASLGRTVSWLSILPDNPLGRRVARDLRAAGVDVEVRWEPAGRIGTYFVELDGGPSGVSVIYDRTGSAASTMTPDRVAWEVVSGAQIVHLSGITAALSPGCRETSLEVAQAARDSQSMLSVDVNHRPKLWSAEQARGVLSNMAGGADLLTCTLEDARDVFGIAGEAELVAHLLADRLGCRIVVVTRGADGAVLVSGDTTRFVGATPTTIVDRLGAGDAFVAGLLDGLLDGDVEAGMERGSVLAAAALASRGDQVTISRSELNAMLASPHRRVDR